MKSSIKIDFIDNGKGLEPVIVVKVIDSDDVRDGLFKMFFQSLGGQSSWVRVSYDAISENENIVRLYPVRYEELEETISIMQSRI